MTYRQAISFAMAQEMRRDPRVVFFGEDVAAAGGVMKATEGLLEEFGPKRVRDTPISEQAIVGAAAGAAMTGLRPIVEVMFGDFVACCWEAIANEIPKLRYMTGGQVTLPLVITVANGGGLGFGAQHSQAIENWALAVPGIKVVAPSNPRDLVGLMAASIRSDDPVLFCEHKALFGMTAEVPEHVDPIGLGEAALVRQGTHVTLLALASTVPLALEAAAAMEEVGVSVEVIDLRCLVPLDASAVLESVARTGRLVIVEENPYQGGWGGTVASIVAEEGFHSLDAPITRVAAECVPIPFNRSLEQQALPTLERLLAALRHVSKY